MGLKDITQDEFDWLYTIFGCAPPATHAARDAMVGSMHEYVLAFMLAPLTAETRLTEKLVALSFADKRQLAVDLGLFNHSPRLARLREESED